MYDDLFHRGPMGFSMLPQVEYAVIPTELDETADVHGDDLSDAAKQCRFRAGTRHRPIGFGSVASRHQWGSQFSGKKNHQDVHIEKHAVVFQIAIQAPL